MPVGAVSIEGLAAFRRDLRKIDPQLVRGVRDGLKDAAKIVGAEAKDIAGKHSASGDTVKGIKHFTSGNRAGVRSKARRASAKYPSGYEYPRRYEFGDRKRPFLHPALEAKRDDVVDELDRVLDSVARTFQGG